MKNLEEIVALLPEKVWLTYVDYRDNFDEQYNTLQECVHNSNYDSLYENTDNWFQNQEFDSVKRIIKKLRKAIMSKFEIKKFKAKELIEQFDDEIKDVIYQRNNSDPIKDCFRNTSKFICFFDTGLEMESDSWSWNTKTIEKERQRIKKILKIRGTDKYDAGIEDMIRMASSGGKIVVYFRVNVQDLIPDFDAEKATMVQFENAVIAIVEHSGGSGWYTELPGYTFKIPYSSENVFIDKTIKYNFTYSVCGMSENWCDNTKITLLYEKTKLKVAESKINAELDKEAELKKRFSAGQCTAGDMDIYRHQDVYYRNDYPCGNKCPHCGTFWID